VTKAEKARLRREMERVAEAAGPTLPKSCECPSPIRIDDDPLMGVRCLRCGKGLAK
jgi:hypothetical protein